MTEDKSKWHLTVRSKESDTETVMAEMPEMMK